MFYVYGILNIKSGKFYIGKAENLKKRFKDHKRLAISGSNDCPKIYNAIRKYGIDNFEFLLIQSFESERDSLDAEIYYIKFFDCIKNGYNCLEDANSRIGYITSEETKAKQSFSRKEFYKKNNHFYFGKIRDDSTKQKISKTLTGKYFGEDIKNSKLTNSQRIEIIKLSDLGESQRSIAKKFNVSQWSIFNIIKYRKRYEI